MANTPEATVDLLNYDILKILLITQILCFAAASARNGTGLQASYDCACLGYDVLYECTVSGAGTGATIWRGGAFDCTGSNNMIHLVNGMDSTRECNDGEITAHLTSSQSDEHLYTSQLTLLVSADTNGTTIECFHDNGAGNITEVGSSVLNITTEPLPPPSNLYLVNTSSDQLVFEWSEVTSNCPLFHYRITSSNCGQCPNTTRKTTATCTGNFTSSLSHCSFAVQSVLCGDISGVKTNFQRSTTNKALNNETISNTGCTQVIDGKDNTSNSLMIIISGSIFGSLCMVIVVITTTFIVILAIVIKSKRALHQQLSVLKRKLDQQHVIYEEIPQLQESLKSSTPSIETGDNTAYVSTITIRKNPISK